MITLSQAHLYGILDTEYVSSSNIAEMTGQLLEGGADILQLRAKHSSEAEIIAMAQEIQPLAKAAKKIFVINDFPHLVPIVNADGVHIGQDDMSVDQARRLAGPFAIVGLSTHSLKQVKKAVDDKPDYIGFGPLFPTATKPDYPPIGLDDIAAAHDLVTFPIFCIGGITQKNLPLVIKKGAQRVVIVSELLKSKNLTLTARACCKMLKETQEPKNNNSLL
ncbi:MAG: thiamine phosphate synthase [Chthoniobacterales bacterium]